MLDTQCFQCVAYEEDPVTSIVGHTHRIPECLAHELVELF